MRMSFTARLRDWMSSSPLGWHPNHHPEFDPGTGFVVAHDILEHRSDDENRIEHELMAIGAGVYVKELDSDTAWQGFIGSDAAVFQRHKPIPSPSGKFVEVSPEAGRIIDKGLAQFLSQDYDFQKAKKIRGWWKLGYDACRNRYQGIGQQQLLEAHRWIQRYADATRRNADIGEQLTVETHRINTPSGRCLQVEMAHLDNAGHVKFHATNTF